MTFTKNRVRPGTLSLTLILASALTAGTASATCSSSKASATTAQATPQQTAVLGKYAKATHSQANIVETAVATDMLSTLVAAVTAADLAETLSSPGPFTVFAPTNAAFDGLPAGTVDSLLLPENKHKLQKVLKAHVVANNLTSGDIFKLARDNGGTVDVETVSGDTLTAIAIDNALYVKDEAGGLAMVKKADIATSNGTVHVVSRVLLPT